jgi:hypothetical protein
VNTALIRSGPAGNRSGQSGNLLDLQSFAAAAGLHPEFVVRLVNLGLIEASPGAAPGPGASPPPGPGAGPPPGPGQGATDELWFSPAQLAVAARIQRLRSGLALNYAALGLVIDLLDRVTELEGALRKLQRGGRAWTRTV